MMNIQSMKKAKIRLHQGANIISLLYSGSTRACLPGFFLYIIQYKNPKIVDINHMKPRVVKKACMKSS